MPVELYKQCILFEVEDAVTLDGGKTFLGVVQQFLDKASTWIFWRSKFIML